MMMKRLRELRNALGISQKHLGDAIQVSQQSINKYENHDVQPDLQTLMLLADYFNVSVDYLIGHSDVPQLPEKGPCSAEELHLLRLYQALNEKEKQSILMILTNYASAKRPDASPPVPQDEA